MVPLARTAKRVASHVTHLSTRHRSWSTLAGSTSVQQPDFPSLYLLCNTTRLIKQLHAFLLITGRHDNVFFSTKLINLYADAGDVSLAHIAFCSVTKRNIFSWNSMISAYARSGCFIEAIDVFHELLVQRVVPDRFTFPAVLKAFSALLFIKEGKAVHCCIAKMGLSFDMYVASSLMNLYAKCGAVWDAHRVFVEMAQRDVGAWNTMVSGFCQNGFASEALVVVDEMMARGERLDTTTVASVLPAIAPVGDLERGRLIHVHVIKNGLDSDIFVANALIDMYGKLGCIMNARRVFDEIPERDLVSWNAIISAYEQDSDPFAAMAMYFGMKDAGFSTDMLTLVSLASICAQMGDHRSSTSVHNYIMRRNFCDETFVSNALVDMYSKLGMVNYATRLFVKMRGKDVISWNALINAHTQNGLSNEALLLCHQMQDEGVQFDQGTLVSVLPACSQLGAMREGAQMHTRAIRMGLHTDIFVATCLIDLYAKCGKLDESMWLFEECPKRNLVLWNAVISGIAIHGHGEKMMELFNEMHKQELKPDHVTFVSLLSACSHAGLVDQGREYFELMHCKYGIVPNVKHYACMVDLLGRSGKLDLAYDLIMSMPIKPDASVWGALLAACRIHGNVELGKLASSRLFELDPENVGYYVLMSNVYARAGRWEGVQNMRSLVVDKGLRKTPGWSSIEINNHVHVFFTGTRTHPHIEAIYEEMTVLIGKIKNIGYTPDFSCVLQDVEEDENEHILWSHSERLAIVFGLIQTKAQTPIHIFKNLRVCADCHSATKFIATVSEREIIVRDSNCFHHFKHGICSCGDYW